MPKRLSLLLLLLSATTLVSQDPWHQKPYMQWDISDVNRLLNDSAWVALAPAGFVWRQVERAAGSAVPSFYRVRLLTARPVREALLRLVSLPPDVFAKPSSETVGVKDVLTLSRAEMEQERLAAFIASHPNDIRVRGDDQHIIIGLTLTARIPSAWIDKNREVDYYYNFGWREESPETLMSLCLSDLLPHTFLSARKRVTLVRYDPPGKDGLGAKFYFPRTLPDGQALISEADKELRFEIRLNGKSVKVKFDLTRMYYKGKLAA